MPTDHFSILDQPRRPWLEADVLKDRFHRASAEWHPDVTGRDDSRFAAANAAYNILRDPVARLRHLLELEVPEQLGKPQPIPPDCADLFMRLADLRQALAVFHKKEHAAAPGLARALLAEDRQKLLSRVVALQTEIAAAESSAQEDLRAVDAVWSPAAVDAVERLSALQQRFAYLSKWRAQVGESLFQLQN
jgi:curved DNA-binding protein CbpA